MKKYTLLVLLPCIVLFSLHSQTGPDYREMFLEGESYYLFEEYNEALPYYEPIHAAFPDNDNINYKIGVCLLNDPYRKEESIAYLERASKNITTNYKENNYREKKAPPEVFFYLGNAYRINGQLDKAIQTYEHFRSMADPELYDLELVDEQIKACEHAKQLQQRPVDLEVMNLGERVNTRFSDVNPVVSGDETRLAYIQEQPFYDALAYCEKVEGTWSFPRILMEELQVDEDAYPTAMNYEGTEMIIYRSDNFIGDLYTTRYEDGFWTPLTKMNENINTKYWESHACFTRSGDTLYFTSNRKGTIGGLDIYFSVRRSDGQWGIPVNLGPTVNTKYNEETPFITYDSKTLYFSSYGHYNMGGYDVFYTTQLDSGQWSVPVNAGYPINTTDDDLFFVPVRNGTFAYYPRLKEDGLGRTDIYLYEIFSETHPRKFRINGMVNIDSLRIISHPILVAVIAQSTRDTVATAIVDPATGAYSVDVPVGRYDLTVFGEDIETSTTTLVIPEGFVEKEMTLSKAMLLTQARHLVEMEPRIVDKIRVEDTLIRVDQGDALLIPLTLERNARLFVDVYQDEEHIRVDSFDIRRRRFTYEYLPAIGNNLLKFKMIDRRGNLSFKDVHVIYTPETPGLADTVTATGPEATAPAEAMEPGLEDFLKRLEANASGDLKSLIGGLNLSTAGILDTDQLIRYLNDQAAFHDYTSEDVDRLLMLTPRDGQAAAGQLQSDLSTVSTGALQTVLENLDLESENIESEEELIQYLREHVDEYDYTRQDVNDMVMKRVQSEYLSNYQQELLDIAPNEALRKKLMETDMGRISSLQDYYEYILGGADTLDYDARDVNRLFSLLSQREELRELIDNLSEIAEGDLKQVLQDLDPADEGLLSPTDLMEYLRKEAADHDYTGEDAMRLLLEYLETADLREVIRMLVGTASGDLLNLLINLDLQQNNIRTIDELYQYLLNQARYYDYTEEEVVRLFLNLLRIIEHEPLVREIHVEPGDTSPEEKRSTWFFYVIGGLILLILLVLFVRRREKEPDDSTS